MKLENLLKKVAGAERIPAECAEQLLGYGITEYLAAGCSYDEATDLIAKAEISLQRAKNQSL